MKNIKTVTLKSGIVRYEVLADIGRLRSKRYRVKKRFKTEVEAVQFLKSIKNNRVGQASPLTKKVLRYNERPLEDYLSNKYPAQSNHLRQKLIRRGIFDHICDECGCTKWLGKPIPLELEHRDGDHSNNSIENLRLLCPNCHAMTPTYKGRNIPRRKMLKAGSVTENVTNAP